jgi:hypothetical protein
MDIVDRGEMGGASVVEGDSIEIISFVRVGWMDKRLDTISNQEN